MSLRMDLAYYIYQNPPNVCPTVFGVGTTPAQIYAVLSGIKKGNMWAAHMGEPPNGIHMLTPSAPCAFARITADHRFELTWDGSDTTIGIMTWAFVDIFWKTTAYPPTVWFENTPQTPVGTFFYGGQVTLSIMVPCDQPNPVNLWESLGETQDNETWVNPLPLTTEGILHTYSKRKDHTNIKIKWLPE